MLNFRPTYLLPMTFSITTSFSQLYHQRNARVETNRENSRATFSLLTNLWWLRLPDVNLLSTLLFVEPIRNVT